MNRQAAREIWIRPPPLHAISEVDCLAGGEVFAVKGPLVPGGTSRSFQGRFPVDRISAP